jgi:hypothetical protein
MIGTKTYGNMVSLLYKPLCAVILLLGLFGLIWLRSSVVTVAYDLRNLEEKKMDSLKERNILLAERAKFMSLEKIGASFRGSMHESPTLAASENIFSNRVRVIHIQRNGTPGPYRASLTVKNKE